MNSLGIRYLADWLADGVRNVADEIGLVAIGLLLAVAIWRSVALRHPVSADERIRMRAAAWSVLRDSEEATPRREPPRRE